MSPLAYNGAVGNQQLMAVTGAIWDEVTCAC